VKDYRSNYDVERLKQILAAGTPGQADDSKRPEAAATTGSRDRRPGRPSAARPTTRRSSRGKNALLVVVATVIVIGPHFLRSSPTSNDATDPSNGVTTPGVSGPVVSGPVVDPSIDPCPKSGADPAGQHGPVMDLAIGAEAIRLCPVAASTRRTPFAVPPDALVTGVDAFIEQIDTLPVRPRDTCPPAGEKPTRFSISVSYPDGHTEQLVGTDSACSGVRTGSGTVSAQWLLDSFRDRLSAQRVSLSSGS
jgi:hypothetical protein